MTHPDSAVVAAFWKFMTQKFDSEVVPKANSEVMRLVAGFLDVVGIQDDETFMKHFTTTLINRIYIPFEIGVPGLYDLWDQIRVCVHEHQHVVQGRRDGWIVFSGRYLTSPSFRANYEAEAFGCDMEMEYWHRGPGFDPAFYGVNRVKVLSSYGCKPEHIEQAQQAILLRAEVLERGAIENEATKVAIEWLNTNAPDLCGL